jgi:SAM-dependent methyltransferase
LKLASVKSIDTVYDLGCGDGRIVIAAAKMYGAHGVGIDNNPVRIQEARAEARKAGVETLVKFEVGDLYTADISTATVITLYLLPDVNLRLRPRLQNTLKPGARVISHTFDMGDWKPEKEQTVEGSRIFLWTISPLRGNVHFRRRYQRDVRNLGVNLDGFEAAGFSAGHERNQILVV